MPRIIDRSRLSPAFPTHSQDASFWEALGRAVAAFGFLEWTLQRAIFALSGDQPAPEDEAERQTALDAWQKDLEGALKATLGILAAGFERAVTNHPRADNDYAAQVVADIRATAPLRNAICHACWQPVSAVVAQPFFVSRNLEVLESEIDIAWLEQLHRHVSQLALDVMDTVIATGLAFPGAAGPSPASGSGEG